LESKYSIIVSQIPILRITDVDALTSQKLLRLHSSVNILSMS
jgi:hypothetical protein